MHIMTPQSIDLIFRVGPNKNHNVLKKKENDYLPYHDRLGIKTFAFTQSKSLLTRAFVPTKQIFACTILWADRQHTLIDVLTNLLVCNVKIAHTALWGGWIGHDLALQAIANVP